VVENWVKERSIMRITITSNADKIAREIGEAARRQVPFATALGLTMLATEVQGSLVSTLDEYFELRNRWVRGSIRITPARKGPEPLARVGSIYGPMRGQVDGEQRRKRSESLAIPHRARAKPSQRTTRGKQPQALLARPQRWGYFVTNRGPSRRGQPILFKRSGRGGRKLRIWWVLVDRVQIKRRWPLERLGREVVAREGHDIFMAAFERALR